MLHQDIESIRGATWPIHCPAKDIPVKNYPKMISNLLTRLQPKTAQEQYLVAQAAEARDQLCELHRAK